MELILESWIFFIKRATLVKTIILIIIINSLHSKGLGGNIGDVDLKTMTFFNVFIKTLALQTKDRQSRNVLESWVPLWFMLQKDIQNLFNCFQNL